MTNRQKLHQQARAQGIEPEYFDIDGVCHRADDNVLKALLGCLKTALPAAAYDDALLLNHAAESTWPLPFAADSVTLYDEAGQTLSGCRVADGVLHIPALADGYYRIELSGAKRFLRLFAVVPPPQSYQPPNVPDGGRVNGLTIQLYSLRSAENWGVGDFSDLCRLMAFCQGRGVDFVGINPLHSLFTARPDYASPYSPSSRVCLNPMYLDVARVRAFLSAPQKDAWLQQHAAAIQAARDAETVDYRAVWRLKHDALRMAFAAWQQDTGAEAEAERAELNRFGADNPDAAGFALFEALDNHFAAADRALGYLGWPKDYHSPDSKAVRRFAEQHQDDVRFYLWLQWLCRQQFAAVSEAAAQHGLALGVYGDVAVGAAQGSADIWLHRSEYCTDAAIGAPPDPFSPIGQNWNLPPPYPAAFAAGGFSRFLAVLRAAMRGCGMIRIDHVMALSRLWWVTGGGTAAAGAYVRYPHDLLFAVLALESVRHQCVVVGEDLGTVSDEVRALLNRYRIFSYHVAYFARDGQGFRQPEHYPPHALNVISTHDLAPLAGYWQGDDLRLMHRLGTLPDAAAFQAACAQREQDKQDWLRVLGNVNTDADGDALTEAFHRFGAHGRSLLYAVQIENLLGMRENFNVPGVADGYPNWAVKLPLAIEDFPAHAALCRQLDLIDRIRMQKNRSAHTRPYPETDARERATIDSLFTATYADPFAYLGRHRLPDGRETVRCLFPDAEQVEVLDGQGKLLAVANCLDKRGFFAAVLPENAPDYRLHVRYADTALICRDPYAFPSHLGSLDAWLLGEGRHLRPYEIFGAHRVAINGTDGVNFAVWAPNAQRVSVVGEFNLWDGRRHPMRRHADNGIWELFLPDIPYNSLYKFEIRDADGHVRQKADPYAFAAELRPTTASVVRGLPEKMPVPANRAAWNGADRPISIYEVHLGSWRRNPENGFWLTYEQLASELIDYVKDMGFTHIELLPLSEYPFDGSWGYQATGLYAPTSRFGSPQQLQALIQAAHDAGIGVILDWVAGHFPTDEHGLARFDGTHLYEHADPREGYHQDWNTLIYNFGRHEVKNFLQGNALYWIERFGFDGLRMDAVASMIYRDYSRKDGEWIPNRYGGRENLEAIDFLRDTNTMLREQAPDTAQMAEESTSFPHVTRPEGLNFAYKWNMGWMNDTLRYMREDPINRKYHHNLMTFGMMYQYSEQFVLPLSHDEVVHGKGSLLDKMPGDCWQKFANLRAYYGFMFGHPGKKLLFMGNEFAQGREWDYHHTLDWYLLDEAGGWHRGVQDFVRQLNGIYRSHAPLYQLDPSPEGFEWLVADDGNQSVFVFERRDREYNRLIVISNFTPVVRENYRFGVNAAGTYRVVLNSDDADYCGSGTLLSGSLNTENMPSHGRGQSLCLTLPPLATVYLYWENGDD